MILQTSHEQKIWAEFASSALLIVQKYEGTHFPDGPMANEAATIADRLLEEYRTRLPKDEIL